MSKKDGKQSKNKSFDKKALDMTEANAGPSFIKNNLIPILIFLAAIFFMITFSNAALYINDEWITANQLHQLDLGHQVIVNEGKYGVYDNGTPVRYFQSHNNDLGYTLMLPLLSLPMLKIFGLFGDAFRYPVILLWTLIPVIMALLVELYYPKYSKFFGIKLIWLVTPAMFLLFLYNILNYTIFPFTAANAPKEVAAIVFTQYLIFGLMSIVIYKICETVFGDKRYSLFGTLAILCCSSYIFWAGNAKDHLLIAFILSIIILCMVRFIKFGNPAYALLAFFSIGLMAWGRPEVAFAILLFTTVFYIAYLARDYLKNKNIASLKLMLAPLITPIGAIPFFLNNLFVMGNPFTSSYNAFSVTNINATINAIDTVSTINTMNATISTGSVSAGQSASGGIFSVLNIFNSVAGYYLSVNWPGLPADLLGILLKPANGSLGLLGVVPILGLILLFFVYTYKRCDEKSRLIIYFLLAVLAGCILAYLPVFNMMNNDPAIAPDMRYLSTAYLPIGILGLITISSLVSEDRRKALFSSLPKYLLVITPVLLFVLLLVHPSGSTRGGLVLSLALLIYAVLILTIICAILRVYRKIDEKSFIIMLMILIALPFAWQMLNLFILSDGKFNGYSYWIPVVQNIYHSLFATTVKF